jgi:hypothetical protein
MPKLMSLLNRINIICRISNIYWERIIPAKGFFRKQDCHHLTKAPSIHSLWFTHSYTHKRDNGDFFQGKQKPLYSNKMIWTTFEVVVKVTFGCLLCFFCFLTAMFFLGSSMRQKILSLWRGGFIQQKMINLPGPTRLVCLIGGIRKERLIEMLVVSGNLVLASHWGGS